MSYRAVEARSAKELELKLNKLSESAEFEIASHVFDSTCGHIVLVEDLGAVSYNRCDRTMQNLPGLPRCILHEYHDAECQF